MHSEQELLWVKMLKSKDEQALCEIIKAYGPWVQSIIRKKLIYLPEEQDECLNDTFLKVWENIDSYDPLKGSLKKWIGAIAVYRSIDIFRKIADSLEELPLMSEECSTDYEPEALIIRKEFEEQLISLLNCLKEEDRSIFIQLFFNGKSYDEVAAEMGLDKDYLYNRVSRGRKTLLNAKEELL